MSRRHYIRTLTGHSCVKCREEFETRQDFARHCGRHGECKHPITIGLTLDISIGVHHWRKPERASIRPAEAA